MKFEKLPLRRLKLYSASPLCGGDAALPLEHTVKMRVIVEAAFVGDALKSVGGDLQKILGTGDLQSVYVVEGSHAVFLLENIYDMVFAEIEFSAQVVKGGDGQIFA